MEVTFEATKIINTSEDKGYTVRLEKRPQRK